MDSPTKSAVSAEILALLRCPETRQALALASEELIASLEAARLQRGLADHSGNAVGFMIEAGLLREDATRFYPIRGGLPVLLIGESIPLPLKS
ncbi:MAG: uncharacterized protein JWL90_2229 [Chthoniobacteraceae bacterium]|nr:uncharacterized protein [Chthoniobacteraceae bacterium]